jgi:hypothetical protein
MTLLTPAKPPHLVLVLVAVLVSVSGCTKHDALVLLDLRSSGPLGARVALVRLSAPGWKTRIATATIGPEGFRIGYYGPADGGAVSVTAEALDGADCVLGKGSATVPALASGATSDPTTLFVRPLPDSGCALDPVDAGAGDDAGGQDTGGGEDAGEDTGGEDTSGGDETSTDAAPSDAGPGTDAAPSDAGPGTDATPSDAGPGTDGA